MQINKLQGCKLFKDSIRFKYNNDNYQILFS